MPLMTVVFGNLTNVFGGFRSPGSPAVASIPSETDFIKQVTHFALQFVYIGLGVLVASFLGVLFWTLSGERISRRIRGYIPPAILFTDLGYIYKLSFVRTSLFSTDSEQEKSQIGFPMMQSSSVKESPIKHYNP